MEELEAQLRIGDFEYMQLFSDILAPANKEFLISCETIDAVHTKSPPCRGPVIERDSRTFTACVKWVEEIKAGVVDDENFSVVAAPYDLRRLQGADSFEKSNFVEAVLAKLDKEPIINDPPDWLIKVCQSKNKTFYVNASDPDDYKGHDLKLVDKAGLELHNMTRAHSVAFLPNPYFMIVKSAGVLDFSSYGQCSELLFVARHKTKRRQYLRDRSIQYNNDKFYDGMLCTDDPEQYAIKFDMKFNFGDFYLPRVRYKQRHSIMYLRDHVDLLIEKIGQDNSDCETLNVSFQLFQDHDIFFPQVALASRISSLYCKVVEYEFNLFFACDYLLNEKVKLNDNTIINEDASFNYGNKYLYVIDEFCINDECIVRLIDEDHVSRIDKFYTPYTLSKSVNSSVELWEDLVIPQDSYDENDFQL